MRSATDVSPNQGGPDPTGTVLFYAGRLVPEKNLSLLIETIARLDPSIYRLAIAGSGILLDALHGECARRGLRRGRRGRTHRRDRRRGKTAA